jgi:2-oxoglutarate ferredoxin oxidoreductase subunit alpha
MPVVAAASPSDCFETAFEAVRIAIRHMTPVMLLSDGYIANGAEPWRFPRSADIPAIEVSFARPTADGTPFQPYARDERRVRPWAIPGTPGLMHRVGGLEKEDVTGNISYDPANHEHMVRTRAAKVDCIADHIPEQAIQAGYEQGDLLILGWGSTYGVCQSVTLELAAQGYRVGHAHLRYLNPFPRNLEQLIRQFRSVLVPEINNGQLVSVLRDKFLLPVRQYNKIQGTPITVEELRACALDILGEQ